MSDSPLPKEIREVFRSLPEWRKWIQSHLFPRDGQYIQEVLKCTKQVGLILHLLVALAYLCFKVPAQHCTQRVISTQ
jgi:hypothetical protein